MKKGRTSGSQRKSDIGRRRKNDGGEKKSTDQVGGS